MFLKNISIALYLWACICKKANFKNKSIILKIDFQRERGIELSY